MTRPTPRQVESRTRNWNIYRLRALWATCGTQFLTEDESDAIRGVVDRALIRLGAIPETEHRALARARIQTEDTEASG